MIELLVLLLFLLGMLKKTGKDFSANCKEVLDATRRVFTGGTPDENTITLATETVN